MLQRVATETGSTEVFEIARGFSDAGFYQMESETLVSTVDIVLPFIDDPTLFGEISVEHALNDIYASLAYPLGALIILGIPYNLLPTSPEVILTLSSAVNTLKQHNVAVLGGHSLAYQQDFSIGFSIFGKLRQPQSQKNLCKPGDVIIVTKRLGTSVASLRWRIFNSPAESHADVITGMRQSNEATSEVLSSHGVSYCTDISGFGLINNLHNLLQRCNYASIIDLDKIPIYDSVKEFIDQNELCTRQYYHNAENIDFFETEATEHENPKKIAWLDSQMSGGLIFICTESSANNIQSELMSIGIESTIIGRLVDGETGKIHIARGNNQTN